MKYINEYIDYINYQKKYAKNTYESYYDILKGFNDYFESNKEILNIEYDDIKNYLKHLDSINLKKVSICKRISVLKSFYKYLYQKKYIDVNPLYLISLPKKEQKLPHFMYYNDLEELFEKPNLNTTLGIRNRFILELLYATGLRVSELANIKLSDINEKDKSIKVMGKGSKERIVYYGDYAKEYLEMYLNKSRGKLSKNSPYLLLNKDGNKISTRGIALIIDNTIKQTNIKTKVSPHTFRHTFATHLLNEGCDILTVQQLLGHESLKATQIYTHVTNDHLKDVYLHAHPRAQKNR